MRINVQPQLRISRRRVRRREERSARANHQQHRAGTNCAAGERAHCLVIAAVHDRRSDAQSGFRRRLRRDRPDDFMRRARFRQDFRRQFQPLQHFFRPSEPPDIKQRRAARVARIRHAPAGQPELDVIFRQQQRVNAPEQRRFMAGKPEQRRGHEAGIHRIPDRATQAVHAHDVVNMAGFRRAALIRPDNRRAQAAAVPIQKNRPVHLAGKTEAVNRVRRDA